MAGVALFSGRISTRDGLEIKPPRAGRRAALERDEAALGSGANATTDVKAGTGEAVLTDGIETTVALVAVGDEAVGDEAVGDEAVGDEAVGDVVPRRGRTWAGVEVLDGATGRGAASGIETSSKRPSRRRGGAAAARGEVAMALAGLTAPVS